jgi:pSer/pThr/pTyr-binding forkhead associated (FHA) protein
MAELIVKLGDRVINRHVIDKDVLSIGRARDNDIVIENLSVSRNHARIKRQGDSFVLMDMTSANGTLVNGAKITKVELAHNDVLTIGKHTLIFLETSESEAVGAETVLSSQSAVGPPAPSRSGVVTPPPASAAVPENILGVLRVTSGRQQGQEFRIKDLETTIGRAGENTIRLHDWSVGRRHAAIIRQGPAFLVRDLGSWRGTHLNGRPVTETELRSGDQLVLGATTLQFAIADVASLGPLPELPPVDWPVLAPEDEPAASAEVGMDSVDLSLGSELEEAVAIKIDVLQPAEAEEDKGNLTGFSEDEFAPMTEDELEALEAEADLSDHEEDAESHRAVWELVEAEKMFEQGEEAEGFSLIEPDEQLRAEEEAAIDMANMVALERRQPRLGVDPAADDKEEEESLYRGSITDKPPYGESEEAPPATPPPPTTPPPASRTSSAMLPKPVIAPAPAIPPPPPATRAGSGSGIFPRPGVEKDIAMWEKALKNKSLLIRKNAAKELKKLTGKDYDWKSEPHGN